MLVLLMSQNSCLVLPTDATTDHSPCADRLLLYVSVVISLQAAINSLEVSGIHWSFINFGFRLDTDIVGSLRAILKSFQASLIWDLWVHYNYRILTMQTAELPQYIEILAT